MQREHLAVGHQRAHRQCPGGSDEFWQPRGHIVQGSSEDRDLLAVTVQLHTHAVELGVEDRLTTKFGQRVPDVGRGLGEHRAHRTADLQPHGGQPGDALADRERRRARQVTGEHRRAAHVGQRDVGCLRHRIGHHPGERALAQLAAEQPAEKLLLLRGGRREQLAEQLLLVAPASPRPSWP